MALPDKIYAVQARQGGFTSLQVPGALEVEPPLTPALYFEPRQVSGDWIVDVEGLGGPAEIQAIEVGGGATYTLIQDDGGNYLEVSSSGVAPSPYLETTDSRIANIPKDGTGWQMSFEFRAPTPLVTVATSFLGWGLQSGGAFFYIRFGIVKGIGSTVDERIEIYSQDYGYFQLGKAGSYEDSYFVDKWGAVRIESSAEGTRVWVNDEPRLHFSGPMLPTPLAGIDTFRPIRQANHIAHLRKMRFAQL